MNSPSRFLRLPIACLRRTALLGLALLLLAPAAWAQLPSSIDLGGQIRERSQLDAKSFSPDASTADFHELRTRLYAAFEPADRIEAFVQIQDSRRFGAGSGTLSPPTNTIDLHQAYFKVSDLFGAPLSLTVGRQEIAYGNQRLIGSVGWHPRGRTFDGGVLAYETETASVDLFAARLADRYTTPSGGEGSENLLGVYSSWAVAEGQSLEVFVILDNDTENVNGDSRLTRFTPGVTLNGSFSQISYTLEGAYQTGTMLEASIGASLLSATADYTFGGSSAPSLGVGYTRLSGDANPADDEIGTFNTLFATNHKFYGYMDYFLNIPAHAPAGLQDLHFNASASLSETVGLSAKIHHFTQTAAPSGGSTAAYGQEVDLTLSYQFADPISVTVGASTFVPGDAMALNGDTAYWAYVMTTVNL
jgi:hypothetical protein